MFFKLWSSNEPFHIDCHAKKTPFHSCLFHSVSTLVHYVMSSHGLALRKFPSKPGAFPGGLVGNTTFKYYPCIKFCMSFVCVHLINESPLFAHNFRSSFMFPSQVLNQLLIWSWTGRVQFVDLNFWLCWWEQICGPDRLKQLQNWW